MTRAGLAANACSDADGPAANPTAPSAIPTGSAAGTADTATDDAASAAGGPGTAIAETTAGRPGRRMLPSGRNSRMDDDRRNGDHQAAPPGRGEGSTKTVAHLPWAHDPAAGGWRYTGGEARTRPNSWVYLPGTRVLRCPETFYDIDVDRIGDVEELLACILRLAEKRWTQQNNVLCDAVRSLTDIFGNAVEERSDPGMHGRPG